MPPMKPGDMGRLYATGQPPPENAFLGGRIEPELRQQHRQHSFTGSWRSSSVTAAGAGCGGPTPPRP